MFDFAEITAGMTAAEILNYYRNLYYTEPQVTERGIVANAINDYFKEVVPRSEAVRWRDMYYRANAERMALKDVYADAVPRAAVENARRDVARNIFYDIKEHAWQELDFAGTHWEIKDETLKELERKYMDGQTVDVVLRSDIAREIFADLREMVIPEKCTDGCAYYLDMAELTELEKKYTEETP